MSGKTTSVFPKDAYFLATGRDALLPSGEPPAGNKVRIAPQRSRFPTVLGFSEVTAVPKEQVDGSEEAANRTPHREFEAFEISRPSGGCGPR